ncbi:acid protease, partial [Piedraia hortae CBS 480.64]
SGSSPSTSGGGDGTGSVAANPESDDSEYLEPVKIGSNAQELTLDFDTGSSDLWVQGPDTASNGQTGFNSQQSSSWQPYDGGSWKISYGDGSQASGNVGFDKVDIGGVVAEKQAVEVATSVSAQFQKDSNNDGLVGLAFSSLNTVQPQSQKTFFDNVMGQLKSPLFVADLRHNTAGAYTFGEVPSGAGDVHYVDIDDSNGWWEFESKTYSVNGQQQQCSSCHSAIADTGTSLMLVDNEVASAFYAQVSGAQNDASQGGYTYDCSTQLPDFAVQIGDFSATIKGSELTYSEIGGGKCFGGIQPNQGQNVQIYGDVFLKPFYAVFDGGNKKFGVAPKN